MALLRYKAKFTFKPEEPDELAFTAGDLIDAPAVKKDPAWGNGTNVRTKSKGAFPWAYLEEKGQPIPEPALPPTPKSPSSHQYQNYPAPASQEPSLPPRPTSTTSNTSRARRNTLPSSSSAGFKNEPWYGGKMKRDEVISVLQKAPDGTFVVRDSTSRAGFSLSVKFSDIRHIVILERNGKFGFSEPTTFISIPELISYFQKESLAHYNAELETRLEYPYKNAPTAARQSVLLPEEDSEELYIANRQELRSKLGNKKIQMIDEDDDQIYVQMKSVEAEHKALAQMLSMFKDQKNNQERILNKSNLQPHDSAKLEDNLNQVKRRLVDLERNYSLTEGVLVSTRLDLEKKFVAMGDGSQRKAKLIIDENVDRVKAEELLSNKEEGTYIIRKSKRSNDPYSLSMRVENKIRHIQIKYDGTRYGFLEPLAFFSLEDLCQYYTDTELSATITRTLAKSLNRKTGA